MTTTASQRPQEGRSPGRRRLGGWEGTAAERRMGQWSARAPFGIGVAYAVDLVVRGAGLPGLRAFGYAVLLPVACLGISRSFGRAVVAAPDVTAPGKDISVS
jgi:hypothetical protein